MAYGKIIIGQLTTAVINDVGVRNLGPDGLKYRNLILACGSTVVVSVLHRYIIGIGTNHSYCQTLFLKRKYVTLVLEQNHSLIGSLMCQGCMSGAAYVIGTQVLPGIHLNGIMHAQFKARTKYAAQGNINVGFAYLSLLHSLHQSVVAGSALNVCS